MSARFGKWVRLGPFCEGLTTALAVALASPVLSQPLAIPSAHHPEHSLAVSAAACRGMFSAPEGRFALQGPFLKASVAPLDFLDLSAQLGAADWILEHVPNGQTWWSAGYQAFGGVGAWFEPRASDQMGVFLALQATAGSSRGAFYRRSSQNGMARITEWRELKQRVLVTSLALGSSLELDGFKLHFGLSGRRWGRRLQEEYRERTDSGWSRYPSVIRNEEGKPLFGPYLALELKLPGRFFLSLEGCRWDTYDYHVAIGIGQVGPP
ncbi:MAG: hypothetical protein ONB23_00145 [candidate division KSB1 bacterium]|nr:hypothetical protein [candidate division KSB1 bacterium]